jgi:ribosomal protein S18 acetylase RimI-like enzyme
VQLEALNYSHLMDYSVATAADVDAITETITLAFLDDPIWRVALARPADPASHLRPYWRIYVESAVSRGTAYITAGASSVALWTAPGAAELSDEEEARASEMLERALSPQSYAALETIYERFSAAHPHERHAYLGFLATHPDYRGRGIAQQLLAENLADLDARGIPAYLESSNPVNNRRYERAGFRRIGGFTAVLNDAPISTMWRDPVKPTVTGA